MSSALFELDDDDDDLFAAVPMPDFDADDEVADPAVTGALSYGADSAAPVAPAAPAPASTVPKRRQQPWQLCQSSVASSDDTIYPVAQSTQLPARHQQQTPRPKSSSHRRSSASKFPGPAGRLPRLRVPNVQGGNGMASAFAAAARQLTASAAATAAARREERAAAEGGASAAAAVASSSQTSTTSNASSSSGLDEEASWSAAAADLGPGVCRYLSRYSVSEAVRLAASGQLPRNKVPAMLVIVETMDPSAVDCVASVKDSTGRLQASLHRQVLRDLRDRVRPGAALVLRRVTLFSPDQRSYYLNITMDNIVRVYDRSGTPLPPSTAASSSVASATSPTPTAMLNDEEVRSLEAECLRPKTPPTVVQTGRYRPVSSADYHHHHQQATPKRTSDSASASSSDYGAAASAKRYRFAPVGESARPQHPQHHQSRPQHPQSRHSHPPQSHQRSSYQRQSDTRVLQESYREAFEDNMDELLASALDDI